MSTRRRWRPLLLLLTACAVADPPSPADTPATDTPPDLPAAGDTPPDDSDTPPPIREGLAGGWTIEHHGEIGGARFVHPVQTDKDGAIVAARLASALGGLGEPAVSDARDAVLAPTRFADAAYADEVAALVTDELYGRLARQGDNPLLDGDTLVFTSVHRFGLYVAEALHAPVLPLQVLSFAQRWDQVEAAATRAEVIVGQDFDEGDLWLWSKLAAGAPGTDASRLPDAYARALERATRVVIVQPDDNWTRCTPAACADAIEHRYTRGGAHAFVHTSISRSGEDNVGTRLYAEARDAGLLIEASAEEVANLKQWEWGVPDTAVANVRAAWAALGRPPSDLVVLRGGVVDLFAATPRLWAAYLDKNQRPARGIHVASYWFAAPQLERAGAILPFPAYTWWTPDWHPLDDDARATLTTTCQGPCDPAFAAQSRAFINTIGSADDPAAVQRLFHDYALSSGGWLGLGLNALGAGPWRAPGGAEVDPPWTWIGAALLDPAQAPWWGASWQALTVAEVCAVVPGGCG
jgi:hypothetical protein